MKPAARTLSSCAALAVAAYFAIHPAIRMARAEPPPGPQSPSAPEYAAGGELIRPKDFHNWIFVGSNLGLGYATELAANTPREQQRADLGEYHNIYISPESYKFYLRTKTFPDKTVLVMDVYSAQSKEPRGVVTAGSFNGQSLGCEVAVKNKDRPDGGKKDWAYYDFTDRKSGGRNLPATAAAKDDNECYACHKAHASDDNVWVQFYPVLRAIKDARQMVSSQP